VKDQQNLSSEMTH